MNHKATYSAPLKDFKKKVTGYLKKTANRSFRYGAAAGTGATILMVSANYFGTVLYDTYFKNPPIFDPQANLIQACPSLAPEEIAKNLVEVDYQHNIYETDSRYTLFGKIDTGLAEITYQILEEKSNVPESDRVVIYINSAGGNLLSTFALYDAMEIYEDDDHSTISVCIGDASSAAFTPLISADWRVAMPSCNPTTHLATNGYVGTPPINNLDARNKAVHLGTLDQYNARVKDIYLRNLARADETCVDFLLKEDFSDTNLTAEQLLAIGGIDAIQFPDGKSLTHIENQEFFTNHTSSSPGPS